MSQFIEMFGDKEFSIKKWSEVLTITNGKAYKEEYQENGIYPIYGSGGIMGYGDKKLCNGDTVILGRKGNINSPIYVKTDYWVVDTAFCLEVDKDVLDTKFFHYWCTQFNFLKFNKQAVLPSLTKSDLLTIEISIPSMDQQKLFVDIIEQADKSKFVGFKSQFIEMFEGDKYPSVKLSDIASEWLKGQSFRKDDIVDNGNSMCIHYGELFTKYGPIINQVLSRTNVEGKRTSKVGDILFPASDVTPNGLARCSMLPYDNIILGGDIIVLRPKRDCNAAYLSYAINQQTAQLLIRVNGAVVKHMSAKALMTVVIPMPPLEEQKRFVSLAQQADKSKYFS